MQDSGVQTWMDSWEGLAQRFRNRKTWVMAINQVRSSFNHRLALVEVAMNNKIKDVGIAGMTPFSHWPMKRLRWSAARKSNWTSSTGDVSLENFLAGKVLQITSARFCGHNWSYRTRSSAIETRRKDMSITWAGRRTPSTLKSLIRISKMTSILEKAIQLSMTWEDPPQKRPDLV